MSFKELQSSVWVPSGNRATQIGICSYIPNRSYQLRGVCSVRQPVRGDNAVKHKLLPQDVRAISYALFVHCAACQTWHAYSPLQLLLAESAIALHI